MGKLVSQFFGSYEEASPFCEVLSLAIQFPELFVDFSILAPATYRDAGFWYRDYSGRRQLRMPSVGIDRRSRKFVVALYLDNHSYEKMGILSRGRQINVAA